MSTLDLLSQKNLRLELGSGESLDVREFEVEEELSRPFEVRLLVRSPNPDVDFDAAVGQPARFEIRRGALAVEPLRAWGGVCASIQLVKAEDLGLSTYSVRIVPKLWLLSQRRNYRVFQDQSELDIVLAVLGSWSIAPTLELSAASYPKRRFRVQYAETDLAFISRLLEDIGVTYHFVEADDASQMVLVDAPNRREPRLAIPFVSTPQDRALDDFVTDVATIRAVRPGRYTQSDVDYRKALDYPLAASVSAGTGVEAQLERYHHNYGSFLWKAESAGGETPSADDRGAARTDESQGRSQVQWRLEAQRVRARGCSFATNAHQLAPGMVVSIANHPRRELGAPLLVDRIALAGTATGSWTHRCEARYADVDYRPELETTKPRTLGVESATVTGPAGEEIHTDELGRVRVRFHWDRDGQNDETSSCWIPVSQPWAGAGFGAISIPRVGQEVLVDFLGADPDRPVVVGRVFTMTTPPPYKLPQYKMVGGMRSESYPRPKPSAGGGLGGAVPHLRAAMPPRSRPDLAPRLVRRDDGAPVSAMEPAAFAGPIGGGITPAHLGGLEGLPPGAGAGARNILPGAHGAPPASLTELREAITRMKAPGPDGEDAGRCANGLMTDDSRDCEQLYLQAQKDMQIAVKDNLVGSVGANRAFEVLGNDYERVVGFQATGVEQDRVVEVTGLQRHTVQGNRYLDVLSNQLITTKGHIVSTTVEGGQVHDAKTNMILRVDNKSKIFMLPDGIVIDAPVVFINPGPVMVAALDAGMSVTDAAAAAQAAADAKARYDAAVRHWRSRLADQNLTREEAMRRSEMLSDGKYRSDHYMRQQLEQQGITSPEQQASVIADAAQSLPPQQQF
jgi:type VI secretion system VgrG family protein